MAIGVTLRSARIQRGLSIEQVAQDTRISARFIEALEDDAFDELPAPVYVRGFLRSYANYLKVDPTPLLDELTRGGSAPVGGPDSFVGGPAGPQARPQRQGSNPFQSNAAPPPLPVPGPRRPEAVAAAAALDSASDAGEWDPAESDAFEAEQRRPQTSRYYESEPTVQPLPAGEEPYRPRRTPGVLVERDPLNADAGGGTKLLALAGGAVIIILGILAVAVFLTGGGDGKNTNGAASNETATATPKKSGTVISVASATGSASPGASATASASPSASASPTATPGAGTPTVTPGAATATPTTGGAATAAPTLQPTVATTPTPIPPTATPVPPTPKPTPTAVIVVPGNFTECSRSANEINCGPPPYLVVCSPNGWFLDIGRDYVVPADWRTAEVASISQAFQRGGAGCQ